MFERIKENIPFLFFFLSGYILIFHDAWQLMISAAMFYGVGCVLIVTRSAVHRLDLESKRKIKHHLPEIVYEYAPYWLAATAIFLMLFFKNAAIQFVAFIIIVFALRNLLLRHNNRVKKPSKF